jgi:mannose-6-phosphate isomerase-like protein (cupin superfamily)
MAGYTIVNLVEVEDMAPKFGFGSGMQARFARTSLQLEQSGISHFRLAPHYRPPFGHRHERQEEIYLVVSGSARVKIDDDVVDLAEWDAVRIPPGAMHSFEGGPEGAEIVAFGAPNTDNGDIEMVQGWWSD